MKTRDFSFNLPKELIAQHPPEERGTSRLMVLNRKDGSIDHSSVSRVSEYVEPGTVIVFNNSRVRKARLIGEAGNAMPAAARDAPADASTGAAANRAKIELLLVQKLDGRRWTALLKRAGRRRHGLTIRFPGGVTGTVTEAAAVPGQPCWPGAATDSPPGKTIEFSKEVDDTYLDRYGRVPLPPYIKRDDTPDDAVRYQTIYAQSTGSIASPTAGLHFTDDILDSLKTAGVEIVYITLHVGIGTFLPIRCESIEDHIMHEEQYEIEEKAANVISAAKSEGRRVLGVGTTSVRSLESAWNGKRIIPGKAKTKLFIKPGYNFQVIDQLFTNFHTPESSLIVLTSSFAGIELTQKAYKAAVDQRYRFFSYGDAMLIQ